MRYGEERRGGWGEGGKKESEEEEMLIPSIGARIQDYSTCRMWSWAHQPNESASARSTLSNAHTSDRVLKVIVNRGRGFRKMRRSSKSLHTIGAVHVLPGSTATENIIHLLQFGKLVRGDLGIWVGGGGGEMDRRLHLTVTLYSRAYPGGDVLDVRAGVAGEAVRGWALLHYQEVAARGTEEVHSACDMQ